MSFKRCVFDIETDGLYDDVTKIHAIVIIDADSDEMYSAHTPAEITNAVCILADAKTLIGHNIINYDLPVIDKVMGSRFMYTQQEVIDTLLCTRLMWPDIKNDDFRRKSKLPFRLYGSHSLEAWGFRIGEYKDDFGKTTDWKEWSPEMQTYCEQDVAVTKKLFQLIEKQDYSPDAVKLEHEFAKIIQRQEQFGFCFDEYGAAKLYAELADKREDIKRQLQEIFPPKEEVEVFVPKRDNKTRGYIAGVPFEKRRLVDFNPASRTQIAERLTERYGWTPAQFTENGAPVVDEEVLSHLDYPECKTLSEFLLLNKRIGQIAEGNQAWLKAVKPDGRVHGGVITNGAVTGRCTHHHPNIAQVPAVSAPYGKECRGFFGPPHGYYQLGCDASGLELRCLAHYIARYDDGAYAQEVLHGDIHTANQRAAGLETRNEAKRFIYAFLYGAGDELIGSLIHPDETDTEKLKKYGKQIKAKFLAGMPALARLINDVQNRAKERNYLRGLDGRILPVRSQHAALNLLLQSAGAIVMKKATCILWEKFRMLNYEFGREVAQMAHIHDEYQLAVREDLDPAHIGGLAVSAIREAGEYFSFRCPLDGEYKTGKDWAECH